MFRFMDIKIIFINILFCVVAAEMEVYPDPDTDAQASMAQFKFHMRRVVNDFEKEKKLNDVKPTKFNPVARTRAQRKQKIMESNIPDYIYDDSDGNPVEEFTFYPQPPKSLEDDTTQFALSPLQAHYYDLLLMEDTLKPPINSKEAFFGLFQKIENDKQPRTQRQNPNLAATKINKIAGPGDTSQPGTPLIRKFSSERDIPTSLVPTSPRQQHVIQQAMNATIPDFSDLHVYIQAAMLGTGAAAIVVVLCLGMYTLILLKRHKENGDAEYPAYGVTGPNTDVTPSGDRRLAQSAQMYHYQHQKQQIIAMENTRDGIAERIGSVSDAESEDENEEGDYTVYECPGFATTGEMEVKNPLFLDEPTPASNTK